MKRDQSVTTLGLLFFSIAIMLSSNVFAQNHAAAHIYEIGKTGPAGGIVFHISDGGGSRVRGYHGLEAAPVDQTTFDLGLAPWGCYSDAVTIPVPGAEGIVVGTGKQNTLDILAACAAFPGIAAELAANYELNGYTDWFLPSKEELNLMYRNLFTLGLGDFYTGTGRLYWSSTDASGETGCCAAWAQQFDFGESRGLGRQTKVGVRAVRAF